MEYEEENLCPTCRPRVMTAVAIFREMIAAENYAYERHEALTDLMADGEENHPLFDAICHLAQRFCCDIPAGDITTEVLATELLKIWPKENWEHFHDESETENAESKTENETQTSTHSKTSATATTARAARNGKSKARRSA